MIGLLAGPLLACGYFLNGGVGTLMLPSASSGSGPPPVTPIAMTTISGTGLTTVGLTGITTGP